jgi:hypothetical protein
MHAIPRFITSFRSHPASVGETYLGHMGFALGFAGLLLMAGFAALIHAFIPPLFETTASRITLKLSDRLQARQ